MHAAKVQSNPPGLGVGDLGAGEAGPGLSGPLGEGEYPAVRQQGEQLHSCPCDVRMMTMLLRQLCRWLCWLHICWHDQPYCSCGGGTHGLPQQLQI